MSQVNCTKAWFKSLDKTLDASWFVWDDYVVHTLAISQKISDKKVKAYIDLEWTITSCTLCSARQNEMAVRWQRSALPHRTRMGSFDAARQFFWQYVRLRNVFNTLSFIPLRSQWLLHIMDSATYSEKVKESRLFEPI